MEELDSSMITISIYDEAFVSIRRSDSVKDSTWSEVDEWWSGRAKEVIKSNNDIKIPTNIFLWYRKWIKSHWVSQGFTYHIDQELRDHLRNIREQEKKFNDLIISDEKPDEFDFEQLKIKRKLTSFQEDNINSLIRMPNGANFS
ncbi:MAG: hypothetical protein P8N58_03520, partial [Emcibacteraceae bacterium]|nr:hypothetical protein [Emcibacteraceae bacterium]